MRQQRLGQIRASPAAIWDMQLVSIAWQVVGPAAFSANSSAAITHYTVLTNAASKPAHSSTTCGLTGAGLPMPCPSRRRAAAASEEEKLHDQTPEGTTSKTNDPTIMATPGPELAPLQ